MRENPRLRREDPDQGSEYVQEANGVPRANAERYDALPVDGLQKQPSGDATRLLVVAVQGDSYPPIAGHNGPAHLAPSSFGGAFSGTGSTRPSRRASSSLAWSLRNASSCTGS